MRRHECFKHHASLHPAHTITHNSSQQFKMKHIE